MGAAATAPCSENTKQVPAELCPLDSIGTSTVPAEWIRILDAGIANNPYTNAHFTNKATADGLYRALQRKVERMENAAGAMKGNEVARLKTMAYVRRMREAGLIP